MSTTNATKEPRYGDKIEHGIVRALIAAQGAALMSTTPNMGINEDKAHVSPSASSPKVAPTLGGVTAPEASYCDVCCQRPGVRLVVVCQTDTWACAQCLGDDDGEDADRFDADALAAEAAYYDQDQQDREAYLNGWPDPRRRPLWRAP